MSPSPSRTRPSASAMATAPRWQLSTSPPRVTSTRMGLSCTAWLLIGDTWNKGLSPRPFAGACGPLGRRHALDGHARIVFRGADNKRGFDARDIRRGGELMNDELLERGEIGCHAFQHEVDFAGKHVAIAYDGPPAHALLERDKIGLCLAVQPDHGEGRDVEAERAVVEQRRIAADESSLLERANPAQTGRRRNAHLAGKLDIGDAAIGLQLTQDAPVGLIEARLAHGHAPWTMASRPR